MQRIKIQINKDCKDVNNMMDILGITEDRINELFKLRDDVARRLANESEAEITHIDILAAFLEETELNANELYFMSVQDGAKLFMAQMDAMMGQMGGGFPGMPPMPSVVGEA